MRLVQWLPTLLCLGLAPSAWAQTVWNPLDTQPGNTISGGGLVVDMGSGGGTRSVFAVPPGSGMFYYEANLPNGRGDFWMGVSTASDPLADSLSAVPGGFGVHAFGPIYRNNQSIGNAFNFSGLVDDIGFLVDYQGTYPVVYVITGAVGAPGVVAQVVRLTDVNTALYIHASGYGSVRINTGADRVLSPFRYDIEAITRSIRFRMIEALTARWYNPAGNQRPTLNIAGGPQTVLVGSVVNFSATANDPEQGDLTSQIVWSDGALSGNAASYLAPTTTPGTRIITAQITDANLDVTTARQTLTVIASGRADSDRDGLTYDQELTAGTNPSLRDTDGDGVLDGNEVAVHSTNPLLADSDSDGISDRLEIRYGLQATVNDAASDLDNDSFNNLVEVQAGRLPNDPLDYPGRGVVHLSTVDRDPSVTVAPTGLGVSFSENSPRSVRSEVAITPGSGWYYFEGHREVGPGDFGFGVGTNLAPLNAAAGADEQSVGVHSQGGLFYDGAQVATFLDPATVDYYGVAVDYTGTNPIVYVLVDCVPIAGGWDGRSCIVPVAGQGSGLPVRVLPPVVMAQVTGPLYIQVYGAQTTTGVQQTINAGETSFHYPANYILYLDGYTGAEFLGTGWGPEHTYYRRPRVHPVDRVELIREADTDPAMVFAEDNLAVSYNTDMKMAVRANEPMIGEFRYFEARRMTAPNNLGSGLISYVAQIDPYPFVPEQQSMSVNSFASVWRNLVSQVSYDTSNDTYGYAVDYRGPRPIVYTIIGDQVVSTLTLELFIPVVPMLYGNPVGPDECNRINFGETPFTYNPESALTAAGVNIAGFVPGWGEVNLPAPVTNHPPVLTVNGVPTTISLGQSALLTAVATDQEDGNLAASVAWSASGGQSGTGAQFTLTPTVLGTLTLAVSVTDIDETSATRSYTIQVVPPDSDSDGLSDDQEALLGTNPNLADTDSDGRSDSAEVQAGTSPVLADTDGDGMNDGAEFLWGFNPNLNDAGLDLDNDGYTNLVEVQGASDPTDPLSIPVPLGPGPHLSEIDRYPTVRLTSDRMGVVFGESQVRGVRSDTPIMPGSGYYYFEVERRTAPDIFGFGVATGAAPLDTQGGGNTQSLTVSAWGPVNYNGVQLTDFRAFFGQTDIYGMAVDYRGDHPIVYLLTAPRGDPGNIAVRVRMETVHEPLYFYAYGVGDGRTLALSFNAGADRVNHPFHYDPVALINAGYYRGGEGMTLRWADPTGNQSPLLTVNSPSEGVLANEPVTFTASALDLEDGDLSAAVVWVDGLTQHVGATYTPDTANLGARTIQVRATDSATDRTSTQVLLTVLASGAEDSDFDGLGYTQERTLGTHPMRRDTDGDGVIDGNEVARGTNPLLTDSDADGMSDRIEHRYGFLPNVADGTSDADLDGFNNLAEVLAQTDPTDAYDYPGRGNVVLSSTARHASVTLSPDGLGASFADPTPRMVRSDVAVQPGSGWYYFEGHRELGLGEYGFGVVTAQAPLDQGPGETAEGWSLDVRGAIRANGQTLVSFADANTVSNYGIALDYSGANPQIYVVVDCVPIAGGWDGDSCIVPVAGQGSGLPVTVLGPFSLSQVTGPVYLAAWGTSLGAAQAVRINAGADRRGAPFYYPAAYVLYLDGFTGAEQLGSGWGPEHSYRGPRPVDQVSQVVLVKDQTTDRETQLSPDLLAASYGTEQKTAVRANQPMQGEFRYFEARRLVAPANLGQGLTTMVAQTNPYPFVPEQQSMSVNSFAGVWRNLVSQNGYDTSYDTYGFAVDYRGSRPVVYTVVGGQIVNTMTLNVFIPVVPMLYGNPLGPVLCNSINFGDRPFTYDVSAILTSAGVDASGLVLGWGEVNLPPPGSNRPPQVTISAPSLTGYVGQNIPLSAAASDPDDGSLTAQVSWTATNGQVGTGGNFTLTSPTAGTFTVTASVLDQGGLGDSAQVQVTVLGAPANDGDLDGLTDTQEQTLGTNPAVADTDGDGLLDGAEVQAGSNPLSTDTDGDGMPDGWEVEHGLLVATNDALGDADGDGVVNIAEFTGNSAPDNAGSVPPAPVGGTHLSLADRHPSVRLAPDRLGAIFTDGGAHRGVRSDTAILPGRGFYYFEGHRPVGAGNFGFGVASASAPLTDFGGATGDSWGLNTLGAVFYNGNHLGGAPQSEWYGFAVDYRGANPVIHVIADNGAPTLVRSDTLPTLSGPLHILVYGYSTTLLVQQTINAGDNPAQPFHFSPANILLAGGVDPSGLVLGWAHNQAPRVTFGPIPQAEEGESITLTATALDPEDGDLTSQIAWTTSSGLSGTGPNFNFTPPSWGSVTVTAVVTDSSGLVGNGTTTVDVQAQPTRLSQVDRHPTITLTPDRLGVYLTADYAHHGVRSDRGVEPGSGFFYFEGHREVGPGDYGFGVASATAPLNDYGGATDQSLGVNSFGAIFSGGPWVHGAPQSEWYGFAVDYRGTNPVVHVIAEEYGADQVIYSEVMTAITGPVYILVYGHMTTVQVQQTINVGDQNFRYDAVGALQMAGLDPTGLRMGWGPRALSSNQPPRVVPSATAILVDVGTPTTLSGTATDLEDGVLTSQIQWAWGSQTGQGAQFTFTATAAGERSVIATVTDSEGVVATRTILVTVVLPPPGNGTHLSLVDRHSSVVLSPDRLGVVLTDGMGHRGVRSDRSIAPGSGFYYYEGRREVHVSDMGFGVASGQASLTDFGGADNQSVGVNVFGAVFFDGEWASGAPQVPTYGFAVDYRGVNPVVYFIGGTPGQETVFHTMTLTAITTPLYIYVYGYPASTEIQQTINAGNDLVNQPFVYDPMGALADIGVDTSAFLLGWGEGATNANRPPRIVMDPQNPLLPVGVAVTLTASANDFEDGDLTGQLAWSGPGGPGVGGTYSFTPSSPGPATVEVQVTDSLGASRNLVLALTALPPVTTPGTHFSAYDHHSSVQVAGDGLGLTMTDAAGVRGARSDRAMVQGAYHYFEARREVPAGDFGFGVASAFAPLDEFGGENDQSMGVNALGAVYIGGWFVHTAPQAQVYGFAVDYRDTYPLIHVIADDGTGPQLIDSRILNAVTGPVFIYFYGYPAGPGVQQTLNAGEAPFVYSPQTVLQAVGLDTSGLTLGWVQ